MKMGHQMGLALIEILIAALVLSISILGTVRLVNSAQHALIDSEIMSDAQVIAGSAMEVGRYNFSPSNWASLVDSFQTARPSADFVVDTLSQSPDTSVNTVSAKISWAGRLQEGVPDFVIVQSASPHVFAHQSVATIKRVNTSPN